MWDWLKQSREIVSADKSLARPTSRCILFDGENISFDASLVVRVYTEWRTKCHTIDCTRNTFLLLQKHLTPGTELILIRWKIVPNEEHVQCDHSFASQPLATSFGIQKI